MTTEFEYDLSAALPVLKKRGGQPELVDAIERTLWVASAHQDLSDAYDALVLLRGLTKNKAPPSMAAADRGTIAGSLFSQAIILYARATDTDPIERERWFGRGKLKGDDRALHVEVMQLRDKALAHFGKAAAMEDGPLVREALVMRRVPDGVGFAFYSVRAQNRASFARRLLALVKQVKLLAYEATQARYTELGSALSIASKAEPGIPTLMRGFPFDPAAVFVVPEWLDEFDGKPVVGAFTGHGAIMKSDE